MPLSTIYILSLLFGLVGTIAALVLLVPESKRAALKHPFAVFLHNLFNFKSLWIEKILRFFYIFSTVTSVVMGFFMLFWVEYDEWLGYYGLLGLIVMPVLIRLLYECIMMFVLLVKNTIEINKKLDGHKKHAPATPATSATPATPATPVTPAEPTKNPKARFCRFCGNALDEDGKCTGCGAKQY